MKYFALLIALTTTALADEQAPPAQEQAPPPPEQEHCLDGQKVRPLIFGREDDTTGSLTNLKTHPSSHAEAQKAWQLRIGGTTLIVTGLLGTAVTSGALAGVGDGRYAPAGVALLSLTIGGAVMIVEARKHEIVAVGQYNRAVRDAPPCVTQTLSSANGGAGATK